MGSIMSRLWFGLAWLSGGLFVNHSVYAAPDYQATQTIHTTPGPFVSQIYVSGQKERQDAMLGGKMVSTIIRRDQGVAWLLIPEKNQYEELDIAQVSTASIQPLWQQAAKTDLGEVLQAGVKLHRYALSTQGQPMVIAVNPQGIVVDSELAADPVQGTPAARIVLSNIHIEPVDPTRFDLPAGYQKRP